LSKFINSISLQYKETLCVLVYKEEYSKIDFLKGKPNEFLMWVCPLLVQQHKTQLEYIFDLNDKIESLYFMNKGVAGFVF